MALAASSPGRLLPGDAAEASANVASVWASLARRTKASFSFSKVPLASSARSYASWRDACSRSLSRCSCSTNRSSAAFFAGFNAFPTYFRACRSSGSSSSPSSEELASACAAANMANSSADVFTVFAVGTAEANVGSHDAPGGE